MLNRVSGIFLTLLFVSSLVVSVARELPSGPVQSLLGPGGKLYRHEGFTVWEHGVSHERYQVFEPAAPAAVKAGLVIFLHDRMTAEPAYYAAQIRHLCQCGWIVLFPHYQGTGQIAAYWHTNVVRTVKDFLQNSFARKGVEVDRSKVAVIGHGAGAVLAANLAATSDYFGLPKPLALMLIMPHQGSLKLLDLSGISHHVRMIVLCGDRVDEENAGGARNIFYAADRVLTDNKAFVTVLSDFYGQPPLVADELAPLTPEEPQFERFVVQNRYDYVRLFREQFHAHTLRTCAVDAFDWFASFRLFDALTHAVFTLDTNLVDLKKSSELRFMGYWSDGRKLKRLIVTDRP